MLAAICGVFALALLVYPGMKLLPVFIGSDVSIQQLTIHCDMGSVFLLFSAIGLWSWGCSIGVLANSDYRDGPSGGETGYCSGFSGYSRRGSSGGSTHSSGAGNWGSSSGSSSDAGGSGGGGGSSSD